MQKQSCFEILCVLTYHALDGHAVNGAQYLRVLALPQFPGPADVATHTRLTSLVARPLQGRTPHAKRHSTFVQRFLRSSVGAQSVAHACRKAADTKTAKAPSTSA